MTTTRKVIVFACVFLLYSPASLFSQGQAQETEREKPSFEIEEELIKDMGAEKQTTSEDAEFESQKEKSIIIQGEDELLIKIRKKPVGLIEPTSEQNTKWSFYERAPNSKKDSAKRKQSERIASIQVGYGLYNHLYVDTSINTGTKNSAHSVMYHRSHRDGEGRDRVVLDNSVFNFDQIISTNTFKISDLYRMFIRGYFFIKDQELQTNQIFSEQTQRAFLGEFSNLLTFPEQKINITGEFQRNSTEVYKSVTKKRASEKATFTSGRLKASWDYFFGERNSLGATAQVFYADNQLYYSQNNRYIQGSTGSWLLMPAYSAFLGKNNVPWDVHLKLGFDLFISEQVNPIPIPEFTLESQLGIWLLHLSLYRKIKTPTITESYLEKDFFKPTHFDAPQDRWTVDLDNQFDVSKKLRIFLKTGFYYYTRYYYPVLDRDNLYQYTFQRFRLIYGHLGWENEPFTFFKYSFGLRYEYFFDSVQFRPAVSFLSEGKFNWKKFSLLFEIEFSDQRNAPNEVLPLYVLLNLKLSQRLDTIVEFYAKLNNILDQEYIILPNYQTSGIIFIAGVRVQIR